MGNKRKSILAVLGGVGVCALLALAAFGWGYHPASAAGPSGAPASATPGDADKQEALDAIFARFAARLGTDEATINAAFIAAANDTADQWVREGKLSATDAAEFKAMVAKVGLKGLVASSETGGGNSSTGQKNKDDAAIMAAWDTAMTMLGPDGRQIKEQLASGKSLAELAQERGIDPGKLREAMLAAAKAELDKAVHDGAITQANADVRYTDITHWVDDMLNQHHVIH